ncbi:MAG: hypothetical protein JNG88_05930 [Phycisphaerales bacterium]|nr:hypothetical protein [Phycisphaerales bacterium]
MTPERPQSEHGRDAGLRELARIAARGEDWAFEEIHRRLSQGLERFLRKRVGSLGNVAEELAQRTWVEFWRSLRAGRYDPSRAAVSTYVYGVGYKIWLQFAREKRDKLTLDPADDLMHSMLDAHPDPHDVSGAAEHLDALRGCLSAVGAGPFVLTPEERVVLEGLAGGESERSLATRLNLAASTVHARKQSGFHKLRRCMELKGFGA